MYLNLGHVFPSHFLPLLAGLLQEVGAPAPAPAPPAASPRLSVHYIVPDQETWSESCHQYFSRTERKTSLTTNQTISGFL